MSPPARASLNLLRMSVGVVDCGIANLGSIKKILGEIVTDVRVLTEPQELNQVDKIILPGVGSFPAAMKKLKSKGLEGALKSIAFENQLHILGICLGMQLLAEHGFEFGDTEGLALIPGSVTKLESTNSERRIPHVGWNSMNIIQQSPLFEGILDQTDFYFVHSFKYDLEDNVHQLASTNHGTDFPSVIARQNIYGVQFHPEKSSKAGHKLLTNFCGLEKC
jgi:glutamine amidotransferase